MKKNMIVIAALVTSLCLNIKAAEVVSTNWDGFYLSNEIAKTNFAIGEKILLTMTVSNAISDERVFTWSHTDVCKTSFGWLIIRNLSNKRDVECMRSRDENAEVVSAPLTMLQKNEAMVFQKDLNKDFLFTNGTYSVQVAGRFNYTDASKGQFGLTSPPINICITNPVPKPNK